MFYWLLWPVRALLTPFWVMFALLAGLAAIVGLVIVLNGHLYEEWKLHRERLAAFTGDPGRADEGDIVRLTPPPLHESVNGQAVASDFRLDAVTLTDDTGAPLGAEALKALDFDAANERVKQLAQERLVPGLGGATSGEQADAAVRVRIRDTADWPVYYTGPTPPPVRTFKIAGKVTTTWRLTGAKTKHHDFTIPDQTREQSVNFAYVFRVTTIRLKERNELLDAVHQRLSNYVHAAPPAAGVHKFKATEYLLNKWKGAAISQIAFPECYQVFHLFTLLHATMNYQPGGGKPNDDLRSILAKQLIGPEPLPEFPQLIGAKKFDEAIGTFDKLEKALSTQSISNAGYWGTYAYCDLSLALTEMIDLAAIYLNDLDQNKPEFKAEEERVKSGVKQLDKIQVRMLEKLLNAQRPEGGWRFLWDVNTWDISVTILCEFTLSEGYRRHFDDAYARIRRDFRIPESLGRTTVNVKGQTSALEDALLKGVESARDRIWQSALVGRPDAGSADVARLVGAFYMAASTRPNKTLLGGFYSTFAGAYVHLDAPGKVSESDARRIKAVQDTFNTGSAFDPFRAALANEPNTWGTYYSQMFFGRAMARVWIVRGRQNAQGIDENIRALVQSNLEPKVVAALNQQGAQVLGQPVAEAMHAYFLSLCFPILEK